MQTEHSRSKSHGKSSKRNGWAKKQRRGAVLRIGLVLAALVVWPTPFYCQTEAVIGHTSSNTPVVEIWRHYYWRVFRLRAFSVEVSNP